MNHAARTNKLLILTSFPCLTRLCVFRRYIFLPFLLIHARFQAYDDIVVFCLTSHSSLNKIDRDTDKRNIQELTKLSVKASSKESREWTKHCLISRDYYNRSFRKSPQKSYKHCRRVDIWLNFKLLFTLHRYIRSFHTGKTKHKYKFRTTLYADVPLKKMRVN